MVTEGDSHATSGERQETSGNGKARSNADKTSSENENVKGLDVGTAGQKRMTKSAESTPLNEDANEKSGNLKKEAEEAARARDVFIRQEKIFIRKGELLGELNTFYSTDTFMTPGIPAFKTKRRFLDTTLIARYGVRDGLEVDLIAPVFVHAIQEIDSGTATVRRQDDGIGDFSAIVRYQLLGERAGRPDVILDINGKSRTGGNTLRGTGHWNVGGGITLVKTIDPVVFFGRLGYTATLDRDGPIPALMPGLLPVQQTRNPGDIIEYRLGMGFSLNDRVSMQMQLAGAYVGRTSVDGQKLQGSSLDIANLLLSTTVLLTKRLYIEPVVGLGLTDDAFDSFIGMRLPYRF
jgi:hypothetical protein